MSTPRKIDNLK